MKGLTPIILILVSVGVFFFFIDPQKNELNELQKQRVANENTIEKARKLREVRGTLNEKYKNNQNQILQSFIDKLFHSFPQMLFISLPIFALLLKMIYSRHKNLYYVSHAIFSIHLYVFIFVMLFFILTLDELSNIWHAAWLEYFSILIAAAIFFYEYKAMRVFYAQSRAKTFLKFSILNVIHFFVMILLFIFFMLFSFLKV